MLKEAIKYLTDLARPAIVQDGNGREYGTVDMQLLKENRNVAHLTVNTLSGLADYVNSNVDAIDGVMVVHVQSPTVVNVYDTLDMDNDRRQYVKAEALLPNITFERFMSREQFQIMMQANFVGSMFEEFNDKELVLDIVSKIVEQQGAEIEDNGMTQTVTMKTGVATVGRETLPQTVKLKPFRTFAEIVQPESEFILRLKEGAQVALFEADGGAWELNAIHRIKMHLESELADRLAAHQVIIIA